MSGRGWAPPVRAPPVLSPDAGEVTIAPARVSSRACKTPRTTACTILSHDNTQSAIERLTTVSAGSLRTATRSSASPCSATALGLLTPHGESGLPLARGAPMSPARVALIDAFRKRSKGIDAPFEARSQTSDREMPYRLYRPEASR